MTTNLLMIGAFQIVLFSITGVLLVGCIVLFFLGKKMDKNQKKQDEMMENCKQTVTVLVIDKKKVRFKDAGFPQSVIDQAPKLSKFMKVPVVKVKMGPQVLSLIADDKIFDSIPVKKEIKAVVSGLYITSFKAAHGKLETPPPKKKNFFKRSVEKLQEKAGATPIEKKKK